MASSLFGNPQPRVQPPSRNNGNILHQFAEFKRQMAGKDPKAIVEQMLADGRMTQEQFENIKAQATTYMSILR